MSCKSVRYGLCFVFILSAFLLLGACGKKETKQVRERIANVRVQPAAKKQLRPFLDAIGSLKANEEVIISSELDGIIRNIVVDEGSSVDRGAVLATIADRDYELEVQRSDAALKQAIATFDNVELEYQRKQALYKEELVTKQQFDDVSTRLTLAESQRDSARAGLALAKEKLAKTKIFSSLQGMVKEKKVSSGAFVKNGTPLFSLIQIDKLKLNFSVTEEDTGKIRAGQEVGFQVDAVPGKEFRGTVSTIYPHLDDKTRTLMAEALVPNHDRTLKPGLFARVTVYLGPKRDTIVIPVNAVLYDNTKTMIFLVEGNKAVGREVKIGAKYGDLQEIREGLKENETVVVVGQNNLAEGVKINVAR